MGVVEGKRAKLSASDWTAAALQALAEGGLAAVAVEPLAAKLGATKGSFYWHFTGRDELLEVALAEWERRGTEDVIAASDAQPDVGTRLRELLRLVLGAVEREPAVGVELALQAAARHPLVAPVLARVTERRLAYLTGLFTELGFPPAEASRRGLLAYTAYLGHAQLAHATADLVPAGGALSAYVDDVVDTLLAGRRAPDSSATPTRRAVGADLQGPVDPAA
jgi:AcrR family transcriptional regulator